MEYDTITGQRYWVEQDTGKVNKISLKQQAIELGCCKFNNKTGKFILHVDHNATNETFE